MLLITHHAAECGRVRGLRRSVSGTGRSEADNGWRFSGGMTEPHIVPCTRATDDGGFPARGSWPEGEEPEGVTPPIPPTDNLLIYSAPTVVAYLQHLLDPVTPRVQQVGALHGS
jgi:hypothetical protein